MGERRVSEHGNGQCQCPGVSGHAGHVVISGEQCTGKGLGASVNHMTKLQNKDLGEMSILLTTLTCLSNMLMQRQMLAQDH